MERKSMKKSKLDKIINDATSDKEQKLWEQKKLGTDPSFTQQSDFYKPPSKLISIRVPDEVLENLKLMAEKEGLRYQTYIISVLKKHIKKAS